MRRTIFVIVDISSNNERIYIRIQILTESASEMLLKPSLVQILELVVEQV